MQERSVGSARSQMPPYAKVDGEATGMRRRTGHILGVASVTAGLGLLADAASRARHGSKRDKSPLIPEFVGGGCCFGLGACLFNRLYLGDPEAVRDYRAAVVKSPLKTALRHFSMADLEAFCTAAELNGCFKRQCPSGLADVVRDFDTALLKQLSTCGAVSAGEMNERLRAETQKVDTFTSLWYRLQRRLPELVTADLVTDTTPARQLLTTEYPWVDSATGAPKLDGHGGHAEEPKGSRAGKEAGGVFDAAIEYGSFTVSSMGVPSAFWRGVLSTCRDAKVKPFSDLVGPMLQLHGREWIDGDWAKDKFLDEVRQQRHTLWTAEGPLRLRDVLDQGLIAPRLVGGLLFQPAIPTRRLLGLGGSKETSIIPFTDHWRTVLDKHPKVVTHGMGLCVAHAQASWRTEERRFEEKEADVQRDADARAKETRRYEYNKRRISHTGDWTVRDERLASLVAQRLADEAAEDLKDASMKVLAKQKADMAATIHDSFCDQVSLSGAGSE